MATVGPLHVSADHRIVDAADREVLLRGVNINAWGEYFQADPKLSPTLPITAADWDAMAGLGFSVIRLIVSWSRLEPQRGAFDQAYIEQVRTAIRAAAERGISTIVDMHQDAWGMFIATPPGTACETGREAAIGWDGAPAWATLTDGTSTCRLPGFREGAPAVSTAFTNFYNNTGGIRDALVTTWGRLAGALGTEPGVVGFDLFNEPNPALPDAEQPVRYGEFVAGSIASIRSAESTAGSPRHLILVEPIVGFPLPNHLPSLPAIADADLVFSPHNYAEAIGPKILTIEQTFSADIKGAATMAAPMWIGEYGWWDTSADTLPKLARYAAAEDAARTGGAWWQWRQACGDPHSIGVFGGTPGDQTHLNKVRCPDDQDLGLTEEFAAIAGRAYPRVAPGRITALASDSHAGTFSMSGSGATLGAQVVIWMPASMGNTATPSMSGLGEMTRQTVPGGAYLTANTTAADYSISLAN